MSARRYSVAYRPGDQGVPPWLVGDEQSGLRCWTRAEALEAVGRAEAHRLAGDDWLLHEINPRRVLAVREAELHTEEHSFVSPSTDAPTTWQQVALFLAGIREREARRADALPAGTDVRSLRPDWFGVDEAHEFPAGWDFNRAGLSPTLAAELRLLQIPPVTAFLEGDR